MANRPLEEENPYSDAVGSLWFIIVGKKVMVLEKEGRLTIPIIKDIEALGLRPVSIHSLGVWQGIDCFAADIETIEDIPEDMVLKGIWGMFNHVDPMTFNLILKAVHLVEWQRNERFCGRCGSKTEPQRDIRAMICPICGLVVFPRISPAIIVLVSKGSKILLAREKRFKDGMYSVLAGFVEPGETLEDAVRREVKEEVGIAIKNIRYFGSQPWPFPDSLMIAFTAEYLEGEISIDEAEILHADWFDCDRLPSIPGKISIARHMIDWFIEKGLSQS